VAFNQKLEGYEEGKIDVERKNAFFKSSPVDKNNLPQMNSKKVFFCEVARFKVYLSTQSRIFECFNRLYFTVV
jgi:hypothetical protein